MTFIGSAKFDLQLSTLREGYIGKQLSPVDLVREVYRRINTHSVAGVWTSLVAEEDAVVQAENLLTKNPFDLPLYGIPFAVKDNIHVEGMTTTAGCPGFAHLPEATASVVQKMLDAGAILIGKNTLDQFATGLVGIRSNPHPSNSFNSNYIPGGSSSGSAVAVASGLVSFALASDTGGSGRVPAALNNIVGLKPTPGIISSHGMVYANRSFDCVPIFALTCEDAKAVFDCALGPDEKDCFMRTDLSSLNRPDYGRSNFKVGIPREQQLNFFGDKLAKEAFESATSRISAMGGSLHEIDFESFTSAGRKLFNGPYLAERLASVGDFLKDHRDKMNSVVADIIASASQYTAVDFVKDNYELQYLRSRVVAIMASVDLIMVPTTGTIYTINEVEENPKSCNTNMGYYTYFSNLLQLSALALPSSIRSDQLPFGVCFLAGPMEDRSLLELGARWQSAAALPLGAPINSRWQR